ncbi:MAG: DNA polymerase III subunit delta [Litorilinea sp.]
MILLLLDCDEYLAAQRVAALKQGMGDPEMASLNTTVLAGPQTDAGDLLGQANMMPFLSERRLVIVEGYLAYLDKRMAASKSTDSAAFGEAARLLEGLPLLSESADLVLVDDKVDKRRPLWRGFTPEAAGAGKDAGKVAAKVAGLADLVKAEVITLESAGTPDARALPGWIQTRAKAKRVEIQPQAVQLLAAYVGPNLRQLDNELDKLAAYARGRAVNGDDVNLLVSDASEAMIWSLTDALSQRNGRGAMRALGQLRRNEANAFYLLTMIARQYRIMLKVKDAMQRGPGRNETDIAKELGEKPFPVKKAMQQATQYSQPYLVAVMDRLLAADYAMKTGTDPDTEMDVLVAELCAVHRARR